MKVEFLGVGSCFNFPLGNTAALIDDSILIDCGHTVPAELKKLGKLDKITDIVITHSHGDHLGGLEAIGFLYYFVFKRRPRLWIFEDIWCSLALGMGQLQSDHGAPLRASLETYFDTCYLTQVDRADVSLEIGEGLPFFATSTAHIENMLSTSLVLNNNTIYTGDIKAFDPDLIESATELGAIKAIFHDCQLFDSGVGNVHPYIGDLLKQIPKKLKSKTWFMHYGEDFERWKPMVKEAGFPGFVEKGQVFEL